MLVFLFCVLDLGFCSYPDRLAAFLAAAYQTASEYHNYLNEGKYHVAKNISNLILVDIGTGLYCVSI